MKKPLIEVALLFGKLGLAVQSFLKGVSAAVVTAVLSIVIALARAALVDAWTVAIALVALLLLVRCRVETWQLAFGGATSGRSRRYFLG
jgi:chromate transporter